MCCADQAQSTQQAEVFSEPALSPMPTRRQWILLSPGQYSIVFALTLLIAQMGPSLGASWDQPPLPSEKNEKYATGIQVNKFSEGEGAIVCDCDFSLFINQLSCGLRIEKAKLMQQAYPCYFLLTFLNMAGTL